MNRIYSLFIAGGIFLSVSAPVSSSEKGMPIWNKTLVDEEAVIKEYSDSFEVIVCGYMTIKKFPGRNHSVDRLIVGDGHKTDWEGHAVVFPSMHEAALDRGFFIAGFKNLRTPELAIQGILFTGYNYYHFMPYEASVQNSFDRILKFTVEPGINFLGLIDIEMTQNRLVVYNRLWGVMDVDIGKEFDATKLTAKFPNMRILQGEIQAVTPVQKKVRGADQEAPVIQKTPEGVEIYFAPPNVSNALQSSDHIQVSGVGVLIIPIFGQIGTGYYDEYMSKYFLKDYTKVVRTTSTKREELLSAAEGASAESPYYVYYGEFYKSIFSDFVGKAPAGIKDDRYHVMLMVYDSKNDKVEFLAVMKSGAYESALQKALRQARKGKLDNKSEIPLTRLLYQYFPAK